jgi:AGZA family xanthine/uracil permease-like MFS transporter
MDNVESAEAAGDSYPTTRVLTADGVVSLIGCLMGNPFINAVYIGHPGWKAMGGRIGYSAATGIMVIILSWFGVISLMLAVIPVVAISPILLVHRHADRRAGIPKHAEHPRARDRAVAGPASCRLVQDVDGRRVGRRRHYGCGDRHGQARRGRRALPGTLGSRRRLDPHRTHSRAIGAFVIDKKFIEASAFAFAGAVLTFFGFMHGESVGFAVTPTVAVAYVIVAGFFFVLSRAPASALDRSAPHEAIPEGALATPAE